MGSLPAPPDQWLVAQLCGEAGEGQLGLIQDWHANDRNGAPGCKEPGERFRLFGVGVGVGYTKEAPISSF